MQVTSSPTCEKFAFDCRQVIRDDFAKKGLPESTIKILVASLADASIKQYASPLKAWWEYCLKAQIDPHRGTENDLLSFLTKKFEAGASYGTLNTARSAVSLISINEIATNGVSTRFFKGIFRLRPTKAKYEKTWDPSVVLRTLAGHCAVGDSNLQKISEKLVTLMALATAHRIQTLSLIKIQNVKRSKDGFEIGIPELIKTSRPGQCQPLFLIRYFEDKPEICVAFSINSSYEKRL